MKLNLKKRFTNKTFCVAFISAIILLLQQLGLGEYLPSNLMDIINSLLTLLVMLGVIVDPTTSGITDSQMVLENKSSDELEQELNKLKEKMGE